MHISYYCLNQWIVSPSFVCREIDWLPNIKQNYAHLLCIYIHNSIKKVSVLIRTFIFSAVAWLNYVLWPGEKTGLEQNCNCISQTTILP